jgi:CheY-like chemotaxis protein
MAKILLVDDEKQLRSMLRIALESAGHEVEEAVDGKEAIESYRNHPADLLLTDIVMPGQEGIETIMQFREKYPELKIIAMSGGGQNSGQSYLDWAKKLGANRTLAKPFSIEGFLGAVQEVLRE